MTNRVDDVLQKPDIVRVLAGLKPFQRRSVDYVFERLFAPSGTRKFLLADEVGLGKTLVARGVIAKTIERLWDQVDRIDIVYICSNQDIARQNINRLNVTGREDFSLASRITMLAAEYIDSSSKRRLKDQRLNFVSFTPGTSFDLKSALGIAPERVLLYHLLKKPWALSGSAPINVLQGDSGADSFRRRVDQFENYYQIDDKIAAAFSRSLSEKRDLKKTFETLCDAYHRSDARVSDDHRAMRSQLVGELRSTLAISCLDSLQPDLIILDEFQRFKHLLSNESEAGELAHNLFNYSDAHSQARVLLLSATPYKMYTMSHEAREDDHYRDFIDTMRFLFHDESRTAELESLLKEYRRLLFRIADDPPGELQSVLGRLQELLRTVICRTERLAVTDDRSGMLKEIASSAKLQVDDVRSYGALQRVARAIDHSDALEYWKSSPYLLSFMDDYKLKEDFRANVDQPDLISALSHEASDGIVLPWEAIRAYTPIASKNARLRSLAADTIDHGAWKALWIPPSLPYYQIRGAMSELPRGFTKRLVFSSWKVVPKAVATLLSYEAERRMIKAFQSDAINSIESRRAMGNRLNFSTHERVRGMPVLGMLYPSTYLARALDPMLLMCDQPEGSTLDVDEVIGLASNRLESELADLVKDAPTTGKIDENWYWAAPILLDFKHEKKSAEEWWSTEHLAEAWAHHQDDEENVASDDSSTGWSEHVSHAKQLISGGTAQFGRPPEDLSHVLALLAIGGPAVCALRALARITGGPRSAATAAVRIDAARIAFAFRSLFNSPDAMCLIRGLNGEEPYWQRVLEYCVEGCLQSVLDEYVHVLREWLGDGGAEPEKISADVSRTIAETLGLQVATPGVDRIVLSPDRKTIEIQNERLRSKFAMRFGDEKATEGSGPSRADQVRKAFNSPFWPFVLITTSVGQEGLDFHTYCHAIMHWNLPANPVDMEQREGRVHRYKGHAVRRNVAKHYGAKLIGKPGVLDPWQHLFDVASAEDAGQSGGLIPYWIFTTTDGCHIERHVPSLPLSKESEYLPALRNSLAVYRMVFGQPRQDDLVNYLAQALKPEEVKSRASSLCLDLSPVDFQRSTLRLE